LVLVDPELQERERAQFNEMSHVANESNKTPSKEAPSERPRSTASSSKDVLIWVALVLGVLILVALAVATGLSQPKL
jgi:hypothetical protein